MELNRVEMVKMGRAILRVQLYILLSILLSAVLVVFIGFIVFCECFQLYILLSILFGLFWSCKLLIINMGFWGFYTLFADFRAF